MESLEANYLYERMRATCGLIRVSPDYPSREIYWKLLRSYKMELSELFRQERALRAEKKLRASSNIHNAPTSYAVHEYQAPYSA